MGEFLTQPVSGRMPLWCNPVIVVLATLAAVIVLSVIVHLIGEAVRARRRPPLALVKTDAIPPAEHSAIEEIRREVEASERRSLERDWIRDGEITLRPKYPKA